MKKSLISLTIALAMVLTGCSKKSSIVITTDDAEDVVEVYGGNDFFEPLPGNYTITEENESLITTLNFKIVREFNHPEKRAVEFTLTPVDKEGNPLDIEFYASDIETKYDQLLDAQIGQIVSVEFRYPFTDKSQVKNVLNAISSCDVDLTVKEQKSKKEKSKGVKASNEWDKVLDSYERYTDEYIKVLKKVNAGDMDAYSELADLMQKCEELTEQIDAAEDEMSVAQATRFQKIAAKMAAAASQM